MNQRKYYQEKVKKRSEKMQKVGDQSTQDFLLGCWELHDVAINQRQFYW